jgi:uncharacterized protein YndB with AHSA1/START domain
VARPLSFQVEALSSAAPESVFALLADGAGWRRWAGPMIRRSSWDREGLPAPGGVGAVRKLGAPPVYSREEIVAYDPPRHLAYTMLSGQPVREYRADVNLVPAGDGTRIEWAATFRPAVPGTGRFIRWYLAAIVGGFARRLAAHAGAQQSG